MEALESFNNQWKQRESKVYSHKAEAHAKEMKELTTIPKIDPLSRKVADLVTQRELEMLGIQTTEISHKKTLSSQISPRNFKLAKKKISADFRSKDLSPIESSSKDPSKPKDKAKFSSDPQIDQEDHIKIKAPLTKIVLNDLIAHENGRAQKIQTPKIKISPNDLGKITEHVEKIQENKKKHEDMLDNVEHLKAFKEELHRDYPELGLDNSVVESSFHTNELNELEEACKDDTPENKNTKNPQSKTPEDKAQNLQNDKNLIANEEEKKNNSLQETRKKDIDKFSNLFDCGTPFHEKNTEKKISRLSLDLNTPTLTENQNYEHSKKMSSPKDTITFSGISKTERSPTNYGSKFQWNSSITEAPSKEFASLFNSYYKASFLHSPQELVSCNVPRCHINLANCKSSPIYHNVRVGKESKVKCNDGLAQVDSLRRLLLKPLDGDSDKKPKNFYEKNLAWVNNKNEKTRKFRESMTEREFQDCTFDPFVSKYGEKKPRKSMDLRANTWKSKSSFDTDIEVKSHKRVATEMTPRGSDNLIIYSALSPAESKVGFSEGCAVERLRERAKPMVNYRSINFLN